jgi:hypothetical protein
VAGVTEIHSRQIAAQNKQIPGQGILFGCGCRCMK